MELHKLLFPSLLKAKRNNILLCNAMGKMDCASQDPNKHIQVWQVSAMKPIPKLKTGHKQSADMGSEDK